MSKRNVKENVIEIRPVFATGLSISHNPYQFEEKNELKGNNIQ